MPPAASFAVLVMAKYWEPGRVKTRLARVIGPAAAARVYRASLEAVLRRLEPWADQRWLLYDPAQARPAMAALAGPRWRLHPQCGGSLGDRLQAALETARAAGAGRLVVLGGDSPTLPAAWVHEAAARLAETPVVLGPAEDGGYYLLGIAGDVPPLFAGMPWGTPSLLAATLARLAELGVAASLLPAWYDVDEPADLDRLAAELAAENLPPELAGLRDVVRSVLAAGQPSTGRRPDLE